MLGFDNFECIDHFCVFVDLIEAEFVRVRSNQTDRVIVLAHNGPLGLVLSKSSIALAVTSGPSDNVNGIGWIGEELSIIYLLDFVCVQWESTL